MKQIISVEEIEKSLLKAEENILNENVKDAEGVFEEWKLKYVI